LDELANRPEVREVTGIGRLERPHRLLGIGVELRAGVDAQRSALGGVKSDDRLERAADVGVLRVPLVDADLLARALRAVPLDEIDENERVAHLVLAAERSVGVDGDLVLEEPEAEEGVAV